MAGKRKANLAKRKANVVSQERRRRKDVPIGNAGGRDVRRRTTRTQLPDVAIPRGVVRGCAVGAAAVLSC